MTRPLLPIVTALVLAACEPADSLLPDGGKPRRICAEETPSLSVKVLDNQGNPWNEATVTGTNLGSLKVLTGVTNGAGINRSINGDIGAGTVRVQASAGGRQSPVYDVQWVCGECNCAVQPGAITLTIP